ncbi:MAG: PorT family protein [Bacteroidales bacterium]|nr:PorT family protein [Bacteroidales bacterium]
MKIKILLIFFSIFLILNGFSQTKPFRFGFKVAPNLAWITPDTKNYSNEGPVLGFSWGFLADFTLTENYFIKTGFNIDYLNGKLKYPYAIVLSPDTVASTGEMVRKYNLRYIEIPLTIKMRTNQFNKMVFFGEIGFGSAFLLKAKSQDDFRYNDGNSNYKTDDNNISDDMKFFRGGLIVGAGIEYFIDESTSLMFSLNFNNGLTNIFKGENTVDPSLKEKGTLNYFVFNFGVMF